MTHGRDDTRLTPIPWLAAGALALALFLLEAVPAWRAKAASLVKRAMPAVSATSLAARDTGAPWSASGAVLGMTVTSPENRCCECTFECTRPSVAVNTKNVVVQQN